jgi:hypothetical protein
LRSPRLKSAVIYFAGPGVELLLAAAILLIVGPGRLLARSDDYSLIIWQSLAIASMVQGVINLIPHSVSTPEGEVANDGLGILRSFWRPLSEYQAMIGHTYNEREDDWEPEDPADWWKREQ